MTECGAGLFLLFWGLLQPNQLPHYKAETFAGLLEVRVTDQEGRVRLDLEAEDFLIKEESRDCRIVFFKKETSAPVSLGVLFDLGVNMREDQVLNAREMIFQLVHKLAPTDEIMLVAFARDVHFLTELTTDRYQLVEALWGVGVSSTRSGRLGRFLRSGSLSLNGDSNTGYAVDHTLLKMKTARHSSKILLVISAGFANIGEATMDHLRLAGARFLAVSMDNTLNDILTLGGDQMARRNIVKESGGISYSGEEVLERIDQIRDALKSYYLIAYQPPAESRNLEDPRTEVIVRGHPELGTHVARRTAFNNSFY